MIIWQGLGFLGPLIVVLGYALAAFLVEVLAGEAYLAHHSWPGSLGTLVGAGLVWLVGKSLDRPGRTLIDAETGQAVVFKKKHTFFFIPLQYQAVIFAVAALGLLLFKSDSSL